MIVFQKAGDLSRLPKLWLTPADKVSKYLLSVSVTVKHLESSDSVKAGRWVRRGAVGKVSSIDGDNSPAAYPTKNAVFQIKLSAKI